MQDCRRKEYQRNRVDGMNNITGILVIFIGSILSSIFFRLGGLGGAWWKNTKMRDFGCSAITATLLWLLSEKSLLGAFLCVLSAVLLALSLSTYWKSFNRLIGKKGNRIRWYNWMLTGLVYGLSATPLVFAGFAWYLILARSVLLAVLVCIFGLVKNPWASELGRGFFLTETVIVFLKW